MCPWWFGVALSVCSFIAVCIVDGWLVKTFKLPAGSSPAGNFKIFIPLIFLGAAAVSALTTRQRAQWFSKRARLGDLQELTWGEFEVFIEEILRKEGFLVESRGGPSPDGGVDLVARRAGKTCLVQCKHWKTRKVGVKVVRELLGVQVSDGADECSVFTSGEFTRDAEQFAQSNPSITLVTGSDLLVRLAQFKEEQQSPKLQLSPSGLPSSAEPDISDPVDRVKCPRCTNEMVLRTAKKGATPGSQFWGCSKFPSCRGTREFLS